MAGDLADMAYAFRFWFIGAIAVVVIVAILGAFGLGYWLGH